jgi:ABC-type sugar transport system substrate-binding protein
MDMRALRTIRFFAVLVLVTVLAVVFAVPTTSAAPTAPALPQSFQGKALTVGIQVPDLVNPFWVNYVNFMKQTGKALNITVQVSDTQEKQEKQVADLESLIAAKVDGLVLVPVTAEVGPSLLKRVQEAKIPTVIADRYPGSDPDPAKNPYYISFIGPDDEQAGYDIAMALINAGAKKLVAISGLHGSSVAEGRSKGLHKALAEQPDVKLLAEEWGSETRERAQPIMEDFLSRFPGPGFDGAWHLNDDSAMGSMQALKNAGVLGKVKLAGMDLIPDAIQQIKAGNYLFSTGGHWLQGGFGLIMLFDKLNGIDPAERVVRLKLMGVTQQTVDQFLDQFINNPPSLDVKSMSRFYNPSAKSYFEISLK